MKIVDTCNLVNVIYADEKLTERMVDEDFVYEFDIDSTTSGLKLTATLVNDHHVEVEVNEIGAIIYFVEQHEDFAVTIDDSITFETDLASYICELIEKEIKGEL